MIDLFMDDTYGGWWKEGKGFYQIEGRNAVTQSSPLLSLSLYNLTGDREVFERRARPTIEYLLSRDAFHFAPVPSDFRGDMRGRMSGPVGGYGTAVYGGYWKALNERTPIFREIALSGDEVKGGSLNDWLERYLLTGERFALDRAIRTADAYIEEVLEVPSTGEVNISGFFLIHHTPDWEGLLRLYEVTGEPRFLDAAVFGARQVMTGMWTQPTPAMEEVTIHPGGRIDGDKMHLRLHKGGETFRLGFPIAPGDVSETRVADWLVSNVGLGLEQPSTYSYRDNGGRMITMANWAPWFLRLAHHTGDEQFAAYARNATVGRWSNYPGYYYTTFTDLAQNPSFPYEGPDFGFIYYHHIPTHLAWNIDYLVSDAFLLSEGAVDFPGLRQVNYAYFDNLVYGHAPGHVFGDDNVWLWLRRGLVKLDNPQINHLTAHDGDSFYVILMNQNRESETVGVRMHPEAISPQAGNFTRARLVGDNNAELPLSDNTASLTIEPRGLVVLRIDGLSISVPTHQRFSDPGEPSAPGFVEVQTEGAPKTSAAAIQAAPGDWSAFIWNAGYQQDLRNFTVEWSAGDNSGRLTDEDYPFEFTIPVPNGVDFLEFRASGQLPDSSTFESETKRIGVAP